MMIAGEHLQRMRRCSSITIAVARMSIAMPQFNGEVKRVKNSGAAQQVIGHEAKTATFIWRCLLPFGLRVAGFCPRHLRR